MPGMDAREEAIADLNRRFMDVEGPTDVLAFPIDDEPSDAGRSPDGRAARHPDEWTVSP